ncbi:protein kinase C and casein kinase substrate in neurons protein 1 isoform X1 [Takifugu rubripes]|nr:protein kinase C and casein kinase substrate in neurons protein 1-like isoform X1 [Takifugu rubripes]XP_029682812.1 protein kinase C and casein kinase substrate in neurons protein 1-like isoform X1 [Takifugu rubripes]XP_029682813.1 protein kinase C and casein kinase substrate in neurons protein 1-like isoform X1 [Takifugu rubripes]|eukprot:XP_011615525.1 PREDICTED: protein kinase C and casein kinase substrate in neurons protein 1-like [Takifugu rubripes]
MSGIMSGIFDETGSQEETSNSFWEIGNYKHTVKRIDDGHRLCNDLMSCIQERAKIEKSYSQQLSEWSKRWRQLIDKGPQYGTVERAWLALMTEAEKVSELHQDVKNCLMNEDFEKVKNWQKETYHKQMMGGFKETREADEGFKKAQKPWAKKLKELEAAKKSYHMACKDEKVASVREANSKEEASVTADQQKRLNDKLDKCKQESEKAKEKYVKVLDELNKCTQPYNENMEQVFDQCQQFEEKRLHFFREVLLDVKHHLNLTEDQSLTNVYRELESTVTSASPQEDLKWFFNIHGPGMHMNWPHFEEYNPDLTHSISKKERSKKGSDGVMLTNVMSAVGHCPSGDQKSISSYEQNQTYTAYAHEDTNGGFNPFNEDVHRGVRVRALYHYEGQEQDELSFRAGDELTKLEDEDEQGWCKGRLDNGKLGLYPANYVELI